MEYNIVRYKTIKTLTKGEYMKKFQISYNLVTLMNLIKREFDKSLNTLNTLKKRKSGVELTSSNVHIIKFLYENRDKEISQKDIEVNFSLTAPTISANLKLMEKNGLVTRKYSTKDTRVKIVMLTQKAIDMEIGIRNNMIPVEEKFNRALNEDEQKQLLVLLEKIKSEFE
jgi:DNA-binding MarR family transcriptional regulator